MTAVNAFLKPWRTAISESPWFSFHVEKTIIPHRISGPMQTMKGAT